MVNQANGLPWSKPELANIAKWQRRVISGVSSLPLIGMLLVVCNMGTALKLLSILLLPPFFIYCIYCSYRLAQAIHKPFTPLQWIVLLVPIVNLMVMVTLNKDATQILQRSNLRVGLCGVDPRDVDEM